ncbi:retrotransposon protein, putative, ty1-copia subclass, partial [Tanacetum coccineum]
MTHDLWKVCNDYGVIVDAFIPYKKSKEGKRFSFVRLIKVDNIDRLVKNLCTIWIGRFHLHANVACFHRERKLSAHSHPSNANERNSPGSSVSILLSRKTNNVMSDQVLPSVILDESCISDRDFSLSLMDKVKDITVLPNLYVIMENEDLQNLSLTYLGGLWVLIETISISVKEKLLNHIVIVKGSVYRVRAKEMEAYDLFICNDSYESESSDDEEHAEDDGSQSGDKVTTDNDVERVSESSYLTENRVLWDYIHHLIDQWDGDYVIMGDFNEVRTEQERYGSVFNVQGGSNEEDLSDRSSLLKELNDTNSTDSLEATQKYKVCQAIEDGENTKLSLEQQAGLEQNVSNEVINSAVWDCGANKSSDPDGFTFEFFYGCYCPKHKQYDYQVNSPTGKLTGSNFTNWFQNLRIFLRSERKLVHLEPLAPLPYPVLSQAVCDAYDALLDAHNEVECLMLDSMSPELQKALENYIAYDMIQELKTMFEEQAKHELFEIVKAFHACKQEEDQSVFQRRLKLPPCWLYRREESRRKKKKKPQGSKGKGKGKNKLAYDPKPKIPPPPKKEHLAKDFVCYHYEEGLRESRKLKHGALSQYMGNGMRPAIKAIRSFNLILPSDLIIVLDNCHFAPPVTRGVFSISRLVNNGYIHTFTNYGISVSKDNVFYFNAIPHDDIYEIDMHNLYLNVSSIYNVSNKRAKHGLDSYYLRHCRLGHINKKRMDILQRDGLLQYTHDESHEKCKSCISGKMVRNPFPHQVERAKDLLGLIHTDVCGPFRTMSREGASYFITFTDDISRYGFVYLMKHKHEVFETFKFVNHMKSFGIVSQLTLPYTSQHNVVVERRNQTLLDMVQSMMNLTTLPKSFWGYALETAARILNMVPTKKVDRTPYEIWHGKSPKLSYLRVWGCEALIKRDTLDKLDSRSIKYIFVEASGSHGLLEMSGSDKGLELIQEEDIQPSKNTSKEYTGSHLPRSSPLELVENKLDEKKLKFVEQPIGPARDPETADPDTIGNKSIPRLLTGRRSVSKILSLEDEKLPGHFIHKYNMHNMGKTLAELYAMLKLYEKGIPNKAETPTMLAIREGRIQKDKKKKPQRVSERRNRTLLDMVRSMMNLTTLPKSFWGYTLETTARILKMVPTKKVDRTPYKIWHGKSPKLSYLRVWGCEALVKRDMPDKLDSRSIKSVRIPQVPDRYGYYLDIEEYELGDLNEPPNYKAALANPEYDKWLEAMNTEMQSMKDNQVWYLVDLPSNGRTVGCKWLFKKKTDMDGNVHTFKA